MATIGWYVQFVHYPAFKSIRPENWSEFHRFHSLRTGFIVLPAMLIEGVGAFINAFTATNEMWRGAFGWLGALLALFALGWTFGVSSLIHGSLSSEYDEGRIDQLIATNWPRCVAWTAHVLVLFLLITLK